jgi:hypothetical protein
LNEVFHLFSFDYKISNQLFLIRCVTQLRLAQQIIVGYIRKLALRQSVPSNTSGASNFSILRCFVIGTSGLTCTKFDREVRYAIVLDMIVRSYRAEQALCRINKTKKRIGKDLLYFILKLGYAVHMR